MKERYTIFPTLIIGLALLACYEPYAPPRSDNNGSFLVVDAFVNSNEGSATVKLSRATALVSADTIQNVDNAAVKLVAESGYEAVIDFHGNGFYNASNVSIDPNDRYKLVITTDQATYESSFVSVFNTPPIDTVAWVIHNSNLDILVNTHDATGNSRYYRWKWVETWRYHSKYSSPYVVRNDSATVRTPQEQISTCWNTQDGTSIAVYSTKYLDDDVVSNFAVTSVPLNSLKLTDRYSIVVEQQVLSQEAYNYWRLVKLTSESLGTLFDPLPAAVKGNIECTTNADENVIGFFSIGSVSKKRIYVNNEDIRDHVTYQYPACSLDKILCDTTRGTWYDQNPRIHFSSPDEVVGIVTNGGGDIIGFLVTTPVCTDCRKSGGSTSRPEFWQD